MLKAWCRRDVPDFLRDLHAVRPSGLLKKRAKLSIPIDEEKLVRYFVYIGTTEKQRYALNHRNLTENAVSVDMKIPAGTVSMTLLPIHHAYRFTMDILKSTLHRIIICINDSIMRGKKYEAVRRRSCFSFRW